MQSSNNKTTRPAEEKEQRRKFVKNKRYQNLSERWIPPS